MYIPRRIFPQVGRTTGVVIIPVGIHRAPVVLRTNKMSAVKSKPTATAGPGRLLIFVLPSRTRDGHSLTPALRPGSGGRRRKSEVMGPPGEATPPAYTSLPVTVSRSSLYKQYNIPARRIFYFRNPRRLGYLYLDCCIDRRPQPP